MKKILKSFFSTLKLSAKEWDNDNALRLSAALSYYTVFSLAPLLILATALAGFVFGDEAVRGQLSYQLQDLLGGDGAKAIEGIVASARKPASGIVATILGLIALFIGSTGVFSELKSALNQIWGCPPPATTGWRYYVKDRLLSFAMVACVGFLLLVSLVANAVLAGASKYLTAYLPMPGIIFQIIYSLVSFGIITVMFAMLFKVLPDTKIQWKEVWVGATLTAALFSLGKLLIGFYLGQSSVTSAFGASGSLALILAWAYYSSNILFLGAEFTEVYSRQHGLNANANRPLKLSARNATTEMRTGPGAPAIRLPAHSL